MADKKRTGRLITEVLCTGLIVWSFVAGPEAVILASADMMTCGAETALLLHPTLRSHARDASGQSGEELLARISYPEIHIPQEETRFSALSSALSRYNSQKEASSLETLRTLAESAKEIHRNGDTDLCCFQGCEA